MQIQKKVKLPVSGWKPIASYEKIKQEFVKEVTSMTVFRLNTCFWLLLGHKVTYEGLFLVETSVFKIFASFKISSRFWKGLCLLNSWEKSPLKTLLCAKLKDSLWSRFKSLIKVQNNRTILNLIYFFFLLENSYYIISFLTFPPLEFTFIFSP